MIKMVVQVYRKPGLKVEEFEDYWENQHGPLVKRLSSAMGFMRYVQSHNRPSEAIDEFRRMRGWPDPCEALAEVWWESEAAMIAATSSPEGQAASRELAEDEAKFCDMTRLSAFLTEEKEILNRANPGPLNGRFALVTGGASGMGEATTLEFAARGARVLCVDLDEGKLQGLANLAASQGRGDQVLTFTADLTSAEDRERLVAFANEAGTIDVIINNAGAFDQTESALSMSMETWERIFAINITAHFQLAQAFVPGMINQGKGGAIIGIASAAGLVGGGGGIAYTASKHAVLGLNRSLAVEFGSHGIRCNTICPGVVQTPMLDAIPAEYKAKLDAFVASLPAQRIGEPNEIARTAAFLASDDASYIHGAVLPVDGGYTAV